ncbi:MAG TPA: alpha/beta hydrolase-fold protein [Mobilitalea sp.]|nr:alpha/beta hydrolase-fold protein [Mobilitalea sp.]
MSFDPQLPLGQEAGTVLNAVSKELLPPGIMLLEGGGLRLNFMAADAARVEAVIHNEKYELEKDKNGLWSLEVYLDRSGFNPVIFYVDGTEVLNPLAPIGFGASRPINYIDIPGKDNDFYLCKDVPHGSVVQEYYYSKTMNCMKSCLVYTPQGYMNETVRKYPVLYLQHGHGENEKCWIHQGKANFIFDNLIAEKKMEPCIVVMNNGMVQKDADGLREFRISYIEELLLEDCIPFIESRYRVRTDKWSRAMAGLSMGSLQTSRVTLAHPDLFGYAGVFSGFVESFSEAVIEDISYMKELDDKQKFEEDFKVFFRAVGDEDFIALDRFTSDSKLLADRGLAPQNCPIHIEKVYHGEHEWNVWRMCLCDFAQYLFK